MRIGITGGIGSGKSYVCRRLEARGIEVYDCDSAAKRLLRTSADIRRRLTALIGPDAYIEERGTRNEEGGARNEERGAWNEEGGARNEERGARNEEGGARNEEGEYRLNKAAVAQFLLASEENARAIDDIVHPAVFLDFKQSGLRWMESAILFESGAYRLVDKTIVVSCPQETRIQRVMQRDGISREKVLEWMARQLPQEEVRRRADFEVINDGTADIDKQLNIILRQCNRPF